MKNIHVEFEKEYYHMNLKKFQVGEYPGEYIDTTVQLLFSAFAKGFTAAHR